MRITVIVTTCGRPWILKRCLLALLRQDYPPTDYDIIVVDDRRSDDIQRAVLQMPQATCGAPGLRYMRSPGVGRAPALAHNTGWRAASAPVIAFTRDDAIPARNWLREGWRALDRRAAAAAGRIQVIRPALATDPCGCARCLDDTGLTTANCFVRRSALETIGGFDERYSCTWHEERDFHFALLELGLRVTRAEQAMIVCPVRLVGWSENIANQRNSYFDALLYRKHRTLYRQKISAGPPWPLYFTVITLAVGVVAAATQTCPVAFAAFVVWAGRSAGVIRMRLRGTSRGCRHVAEVAIASLIIPPIAVFWRLSGALRFRVLFA